MMSFIVVSRIVRGKMRAALFLASVEPLSFALLPMRAHVFTNAADAQAAADAASKHSAAAALHPGAVHQFVVEER
jgi:hypothetical protein